MAIGIAAAWYTVATTDNAASYAFTVNTAGAVSAGTLIIIYCYLSGGTAEIPASVTVTQAAKTTTNLTQIGSSTSDGRGSLWAGFAADSYTATPTVTATMTTADHTGCSGSGYAVSGAYVSGTLADALPQNSVLGATKPSSVAASFGAAVSSASRSFALGYLSNNDATFAFTTGSNITRTVGPNQGSLPNRTVQGGWSNAAWSGSIDVQAPGSGSVPWSLAAVEVRDAADGPSKFMAVITAT